MRGEPIRQLNEGLIAYKDEVTADSLTSKRVEVAIVTFGPVTIACDFTTAAQFTPPSLPVTGDTPMGEAVIKAIDMIVERKKVYRTNGISFYRPWIFLITDGAPNQGDPWRDAASRVKEGEGKKAFSFFSVGVEGADFDTLSQLGTREPLRLKGLRFKDLFSWLSNSQQSVSMSRPGDAVPLADPTKGPKGWAEV